MHELELENNFKISIIMPINMFINWKLLTWQKCVLSTTKHPISRTSLPPKPYIINLLLPTKIPKKQNEKKKTPSRDNFSVFCNLVHKKQNLLNHGTR